jgi:hypothetical protein
MSPTAENAMPHAYPAPAAFPSVIKESPAQAIRRMAGGFAMTQVLHTAVQAGIADALGDTTLSAADLAHSLKLDAQALERFLRMMVVLDLLIQEGSTSFRLSQAGQLLRLDHPESMRDRVLYVGAINYPVTGAALHSLQTGAPAFDHIFGKPFFGHLAEHPSLSGMFNRLMQRAVHDRTLGITQAYDFSGARHIVDIGGGNGALLSAILTRAPQSIGTIFDTDGVIAQARSLLSGTEQGSRIEFKKGDLFAGDYPRDADLYLLSNIIHDWNDALAEEILRHCVSAMSHHSTLMLIEEIMPDRVADSPATIANDYSMLLLTGGRERTEVQYRELLSRSGLLPVATVPFAVQGEDNKRRGSWSLLECRAK